MRARYVVCAIEVIEGRDVEQSSAVEVVNPTESGEGVSFMLAVAELAGREDLVFVVSGVGVVGNLVVVGADLGNEAKLVVGVWIEDE